MTAMESVPYHPISGWPRVGWTWAVRDLEAGMWGLDTRTGQARWYDYEYDFDKLNGDTAIVSLFLESTAHAIVEGLGRGFVENLGVRDEDAAAVKALEERARAAEEKFATLSAAVVSYLDLGDRPVDFECEVAIDDSSTALLEARRALTAAVGRGAAAPDATPTEPQEEPNCAECMGDGRGPYLCHECREQKRLEQARRDAAGEVEVGF